MCDIVAQDVFGPTVGAECHNGFDFTLLFEESFFTILPCSLLLLCLPVQLFRSRSAPLTRRGVLFPGKLVYQPPVFRSCRADWHLDRPCVIDLRENYAIGVGASSPDADPKDTYYSGSRGFGCSYRAVDG